MGIESNLIENKNTYDKETDIKGIEYYTSKEKGPFCVFAIKDNINIIPLGIKLNYFIPKKHSKNNSNRRKQCKNNF